MSSPGAGVTNKQLTTAETVRLVDLVKLPSGASAVAAQRSLPGPAAGEPISSALIDTVRYWRVALPYVQAVAWITAHPPAGLRLAGTSGPTGSQKQFSGYMYQAPDGRAWVEASLQVGVLADTAGSTLWRVDGLAIWTDPTPAPDDNSGPRLTVTVTAGCPSTDRGYTDVANHSPGLDRYLLPAVDPDRALVCAYGGTTGPPNTPVTPAALIEARTLDATSATTVADAVRKVSLASIDGVASCAAGEPAVIVVVFAYRSGPDIVLWYANVGCPTLDNGSIVVSMSNTGWGAAYEAIMAAIE